MPKIRILLVDDSVVVRRLVSEILGSDPGLEVVGTAANGRIALEKLPLLQPDLVVLDVEMPEMDGLATLQAIRQQQPRLPVLMFSQHTQRGASATLDALALGADDYLTKPDAATPRALETVRDQLVEKVKALVGRPAARASGTGVSPRRAGRETVPVRRVEAVVIGVSTGGPNALSVLLPGLGANLPVPVFVVQHMPPMFTRMLGQRLAGVCPFPVAEASDEEVPVPGRVYICPGDQHLELKRSALGARMQLSQGPPENSCRPSVNVLFRSAAAAYGAGVLGVVLTGMGQDGLRGCEQIREAGGHVLAQDEASSVVWGMPGAVARAGLASCVLPLSELAPEIMNRVRLGRTPSACGC